MTDLTATRCHGFTNEPLASHKARMEALRTAAESTHTATFMAALRTGQDVMIPPICGKPVYLSTYTSAWHGDEAREMLLQACHEIEAKRFEAGCKKMLAFIAAVAAEYAQGMADAAVDAEEERAELDEIEHEQDRDYWRTEARINDAEDSAIGGGR